MTSNNPITVSIDGNQLYANSQLLGVVSLTGGDNISLDNSGSVINTSQDVSFTNVDISVNLTVAPDSDTATVLGPCKIGYNGTDSDTVCLSHYDNMNSTDFSVKQDSNGKTTINSKTGQTLDLQINGSSKLTVGSNGMVGIGSSNPVQGQLELYRPWGGDYTRLIYLYTSGTNNYWNMNSNSLEHRRNGDIASMKTSSNDVFFGNNTRNTWLIFKTNGDMDSTVNIGLDSDDRIKHNEEVINNGLEIVRQLTPKKYFKARTPQLDVNGNPIANWNGDVSGMTGKDECGFIAQEVEQISGLEWCVNTPETTWDEEGNFRPKSVSYHNINMYLFDAVKKLDATVTALEARIATLENPP